MSKKSQIARRCKVCPPWTQTVCRHAFGVFWCIKSGDGEGCTYPLDDVAEIWRQGGWEPGKNKPVPVTLPVKKTREAVKQYTFIQNELTLGSVSGDSSPLTDDDY